MFGRDSSHKYVESRRRLLTSLGRACLPQELDAGNICLLAELPPRGRLVLLILQGGRREGVTQSGELAPRRFGVTTRRSSFTWHHLPRALSTPPCGICHGLMPLRMPSSP